MLCQSLGLSPAKIQKSIVTFVRYTVNKLHYFIIRIAWYINLFKRQSCPSPCTHVLCCAVLCASSALTLILRAKDKIIKTVFFAIVLPNEWKACVRSIKLQLRHGIPYTKRISNSFTPTFLALLLNQIKSNIMKGRCLISISFNRQSSRERIDKRERGKDKQIERARVQK